VVAALAPSTLLRWRFDAREHAIIAITTAGQLILDICEDEGRTWIEDAGDLTDEIESEMRLFEMRQAACPVSPRKYDATIKLPPCGMCGDDGYLEDDTGREYCPSCTSTDYDDREIDERRSFAADLSEARE